MFVLIDCLMVVPLLMLVIILITWMDKDNE